jgi:hypothetical protein
VFLALVTLGHVYRCSISFTWDLDSVSETVYDSDLHLPYMVQCASAQRYQYWTTSHWDRRFPVDRLPDLDLP